MSSRQWESFFGRLGWSGGTFGSGAYSDGWSEGYTVNGDHAQGATVIALEGGSGQLLPGTAIKFDGDATVYTVDSSVGVAAVTSVTLTSGLAQALDDGAELEPKLPPGPGDQMAYLLTGFLAADPVIAAALGGRIERMPLAPREDARHMPRLYIYPGSVEQVAIAQITDKDSDVIAALVFRDTSLAPASEGGATIASILTQIERVAAAHNQMTVEMAHGGGNEQVLADDMIVAAYQTAEVETIDGSAALGQAIQFRYKNVVRRDTGRIWQIAAAA